MSSCPRWTVTRSAGASARHRRRRLLPVIMITASGRDEKRRALDAGADDFLMKPFDQDELLARVRSLLRIKRYHDTIQHQAAELARWNRELEERVESQVEEIERMARLKRFLSPAVAELIVSAGDESFLESHRREITVVFCDLRGFTTFAETVEPEEMMGVLRRVPRGAGRADLPLRGDAGAFRRRRPDGVLQRSDRLPGCAGAGRADGRCDARRRRRPRPGLAKAWPRPRLRRRDCPGLRDARARRLRGPLRLRRDRHGHQSRGAALRCCTATARSWSASASTRRSRTSLPLRSWPRLLLRASRVR